MADIATISLKADTSDLERGTQKLKEFGDTAEKVSWFLIQVMTLTYLLGEYLIQTIKAYLIIPIDH